MFIKYNIPAIVWSVVILIILALPGDKLPELSFWQFIPFFDKWVHLGLFFIQSALLYWGFTFQTKFKLPSIYPYCFAFFFSSSYAGFTEVLQYFIFLRTAEILDFFADITGAVLGALFLKWIIKIIINRNKQNVHD